MLINNRYKNKATIMHAPEARSSVKALSQPKLDFEARNSRSKAAALDPDRIDAERRSFRSSVDSAREREGALHARAN